RRTAAVFAAITDNCKRVWNKIPQYASMPGWRDGSSISPSGPATLEETIMWRISTCVKLLAVSLAFLASQPALAASAAKEITGYNKLKVEFTKNAQKCGF